MGRYRLLSLAVLCSYLTILFLGVFCIAMGEVMPLHTPSTTTIECVFDCPLMGQGQAITWFTISHSTLLPLLFVFFVLWSVAVLFPHYTKYTPLLHFYHPPPDIKLFSFFTLLFSRGIVQPKLYGSMA